MSCKVYKSADGRVFIRSKEEGFVASFKNGAWSPRIAFNGNELNELSLVSDETEASAIVVQAKNAVGYKPDPVTA
jgi:hypothetical protein